MTFIAVRPPWTSTRAGLFGSALIWGPAIAPLPSGILREEMRNRCAWDATDSPGRARGNCGGGGDGASPARRAAVSLPRFSWPLVTQLPLTFPMMMTTTTTTTTTAFKMSNVF
jgi:hypothetical protein